LSSQVGGGANKAAKSRLSGGLPAAPIAEVRGTAANGQAGGGTEGPKYRHSNATSIAPIAQAGGEIVEVD
jgi:hypothetical protein